MEELGEDGLPREKSEHRVEYERKLQLARETHDLSKDPYFHEQT